MYRGKTVTHERLFPAGLNCVVESLRRGVISPPDRWQYIKLMDPGEEGMILYSKRSRRGTRYRYVLYRTGIFRGGNGDTGISGSLRRYSALSSMRRSPRCVQVLLVRDECQIWARVGCREVSMKCLGRRDQSFIANSLFTSKHLC